MWLELIGPFPCRLIEKQNPRIKFYSFFTMEKFTSPNFYQRFMVCELIEI